MLRGNLSRLEAAVCDLITNVKLIFFLNYLDHRTSEYFISEMDAYVDEMVVLRNQFEGFTKRRFPENLASFDHAVATFKGIVAPKPVGGKLSLEDYAPKFARLSKEVPTMLDTRALYSCNFDMFELNRQVTTDPLLLNRSGDVVLRALVEFVKLSNAAFELFFIPRGVGIIPNNMVEWLQNIKNAIFLCGFQRSDWAMANVMRHLVNLRSKIGSCAVCETPTKSKCSGCGVNRYCSPTCQKTDWLFHKTFCGHKSSDEMAAELYVCAPWDAPLPVEFKGKFSEKRIVPEELKLRTELVAGKK